MLKNIVDELGLTRDQANTILRQYYPSWPKGYKAEEDKRYELLLRINVPAPKMCVTCAQREAFTALNAGNDTISDLSVIDLETVFVSSVLNSLLREFSVPPEAITNELLRQIYAVARDMRERDIGISLEGIVSKLALNKQDRDYLYAVYRTLPMDLFSLEGLPILIKEAWLKRKLLTLAKNIVTVASRPDFDLKTGIMLLHEMEKTFLETFLEEEKRDGNISA